MQVVDLQLLREANASSKSAGRFLPVYETLAKNLRIESQDSRPGKPKWPNIELGLSVIAEPGGSSPRAQRTNGPDSDKCVRQNDRHLLIVSSAR
jgi:hypothetical protein